MGKHILDLYPALIFDRDGIINKAILRDGKPTPPRSFCEFEFNEGFEYLYRHAINRKYRMFVATNQPDICRGLTTRSFVDGLHQRILSRFDKIEEIAMCDHDNFHNCDCRKPKPGLLLYLKKKYSLAMDKTFFIGDRSSDIMCGKQALSKTIFVDYQYSENDQNVTADYTVKSLWEIIDKI